jgi:subtilisin family serine protease
LRARRSLLVSVLAASVLITGVLASPAYGADPDPDFTATPATPSGPTEEGARTKSGQLAESDEGLLARKDSKVIPIMVKIDVDPVASYAGDIEGLAATSPEVTGKKLKMSSPAVVAYLKYVKEKLDAARADIEKAVPAATLLDSYPVAYGGLAITVPAKSAKAVLDVPGVAAVQQNALNSLPASDTGATTAFDRGVATQAAAPAASSKIDNDASTFIGADKVWKALGGRDTAGQGVIIGVIDTGIWPEHPMLADNGILRPAGGPWACEFGDGGDDDFTCNDKLLGAYAFLDAYTTFNDVDPEDFCDGTVCSARDSEGHGTHTATTAAGDYVTSAPIFGVDRGPVSGIAPGASVIAYRALGPGGGYTSDLLDAVQQSIIDGVDVLNYSISGSGSVYTDAVELAFLDAYAAGIAVNASAGNDGPGASTANHAGPWVTTVGASTFDRQYSSKLTLTSTDGTSYSKSGSTLTQGVTAAAVVLAADVPGYTGTKQCLEPFDAGSLTGKVVVCERGNNGRVEKGYNASLGDAAGMILYNPTASDVETDNHFLPAIHLEGPNTALLAYLGAHPGITATWAAGKVAKAKADVMAGFSSRGPIGEFLKPDITAPGVQILAGLTPESTDLSTGPQGELYQAIAGTSMSSPHATGVSALVIAAHPDWTPGQVKSALMTSSLQAVTNVDGSKAGVFDRGAGSIRADRAVSPTLTISETAADFQASAGDPLSRIDLNIPSVYIDPLPGAAEVERTVTNVTGKTQTIKVSTTMKGGTKAVVSPSKFTLMPGASKTVNITLIGTDAANGWHEGQLTFTSTRSGTHRVVMPVAVNVGDAKISLSQSCTPTQIARNATSTCTVTAGSFLPVAVTATVSVTADPKLLVTQVGAPAHKTGNGATWTGSLSAIIPPAIEAVNPVSPDVTPGGGFLPLGDFGVPAVTGVTDESISNFTVPQFLYGGEAYTRIGIVSNGYAVVGGGTSADVEFDPPASFPNAAAPNNVIAPFWSDLDPTKGGELRVGTLTDDVTDTTYIVLEWDQVANWSDTGTNSFQIWITAGATEETYIVYDGAPTAETDAGPLTGAENRDGSSGKTVATVDPDSAYQVLTDPPVAGGTVSFDYVVKGTKKGTWTTTAKVTSDALNTTPIKKTKIKVQ